MSKISPITRLPTWQDSLATATNLTTVQKQQYKKFAIHYFDFLNTSKLELGTSSLKLFVDYMSEKYKPSPEDLARWRSAARWLLDLHSQSYEDRLIFELRRQNYAYKTELSYVAAAKSFMLYHHNPIRPTLAMLTAYLSHLATERNYAINSQKSALNALVFLYRNVFGQEIEEGQLQFASASKGRKLPVVLSPQEVQKILALLPEEERLMCGILYGCGLRISELIRLRIKDLDFDRNRISIMQSKNNKDRMVMMPLAIKDRLVRHVKEVRRLHEIDRAEGLAGVYMEHALAEKYRSASTSWSWFWVFPSHKTSIDPRTNARRRHHVLDSGLNKHIRKVKKLADIAKSVSAHTFRHSFATHMLEAGKSIHQVSELLGHSDIRTTQIYLHTMKEASRDVSVMDTLGITI